MTLQQIIDDRISFLREQINLNNNNSEVNSTFQIQIDAIRAVEDYSFEKVESIIEQRKLYWKTVKTCTSQIGCLLNLTFRMAVGADSSICTLVEEKEGMC